MSERHLNVVPIIVIVGSVIALSSLLMPWVVAEDGVLNGIEVMSDHAGYPTLAPLAVMSVALYSMFMASLSVVFREFSRRKRVSVYTILMWIAVLVLMDGFQTMYNAGAATDVMSVGALVCIIGSSATGFLAPREFKVGRGPDP